MPAIVILGFKNDLIAPNGRLSNPEFSFGYIQRNSIFLEIKLKDGLCFYHKSTNFGPVFQSHLNIVEQYFYIQIF